MPRPPKFDPARGSRGRGLTQLPAEGRQGETPPWPLGPRQTIAQKRAWAELWKTPQSIMWEKLGWTRVVARYCKTMLAAEKLDKDAMSEARQLEDRLGLTPKAMRLLLWQIVESDETLTAGQADDDATVTDIRDRIKAVE